MNILKNRRKSKMEDEKKITDEVEVDYAPDIDDVRVLD